MTLSRKVKKEIVAKKVQKAIEEKLALRVQRVQQVLKVQ